MIDRAFVRKALDGAVEQLQDVDQALTSRTLTEREQLRRYEQQHRGRPRAMMQFVQGRHPETQTALEAAAEYEEAMEVLRRAKNGR